MGAMSRGGGQGLTLGLNVLQVLQNELQARETNKTGLGIGSRLLNIEARIKNTEAVSRNSRVWRLHHSLAPVSSSFVRYNNRDKQKSRDRDRRRSVTDLGSFTGLDRRDKRDPEKETMEEVWEVHKWFPETVEEFKELQYWRESASSLHWQYTDLLACSEQGVVPPRVLPHQGLQLR